MIAVNYVILPKTSVMEAIFKLKASEIDFRIIDSIKRLFGSNDVIIQISSVDDETSYLLASKTNKEHLMESMASEPEMIFTEQEFDKHVKELIKSTEKKPNK
jgi:hypothetical protein